MSMFKAGNGYNKYREFVCHKLQLDGVSLREVLKMRDGTLCWGKPAPLYLQH